ncbi:XRE family transcriptional regulator [Luedemannella flava]
MEAREAKRRLTRGLPGSRLSMPAAYALDDLTLGVLWAVANLDDCLLADDAELAQYCSDMAHYESQPRSAAARDTVAGLSMVSQMWLGSQFCARHILRHAASFTQVPAFWTREQHGEEASTWLLFTHKLDYLKTIAAQVGEAGVTRSLCVPPDLVSGSPRSERALLLLAVALMESFAIEVSVCVDPEYATVEGFVLDPGHRAVVANWVGSDGIWHVDVTGSRPRLREYAEVSMHTVAHSVVAAPTPRDRLRRLADYLELDWAWLVRRCGELGEYGSAGIARPRSRLLSTEGLDRACRFLASVGATGQ